MKVFEYLDVDKEKFDRYATRFEISQLLHRLWTREDCRSSILGQFRQNVSGKSNLYKIRLFSNADFIQWKIVVMIGA